MHPRPRPIFVLALVLTLTSAASAEEDPLPQLRVGVIGLDTSHAIAFTQLLNNPDAPAELANCRVVIAYPPGSPDIVSSTRRVPQYTQQIKEMGVTIADSIEHLVQQVDVVLLESNDGRPHLQQAMPVLAARKPMFVDKPVAGSLSDAIALYEAARHYECPLFTSSSLRFIGGAQEVRQGAIGDVVGCDTYGPCSLEPTHPDLFWYGIHATEALFTVMGTGCQSVRRVNTPGTDLVVGIWDGQRIGTFRGIRDGKGGFGGIAFGSSGHRSLGPFAGYQPLVVQIVQFFRTRKPPVDERETLEIYAFMEGADKSKLQDGARVDLEELFQEARKKAIARLAEWKLP